MTQKIIIAGAVAVLLAAAYFYAYPKLAVQPPTTDYRDVVILLEN